MHIIFDPNSITLNHIIQEGAGFSYFVSRSPYQRGWGAVRQRGNGIGGIFRALWPVLLPLAKSAIKCVGKEGLATGGRILGDIAKGRGIEESIVNEIPVGITNLMRKAGEKAQTGSGHRKKRKSTVIIKPDIRCGQSRRNKSCIKRKREDTFGFY